MIQNKKKILGTQNIIYKSNLNERKYITLGEWSEEDKKVLSAGREAGTRRIIGDVSRTKYCIFVNRDRPTA